MLLGKKLKNIKKYDPEKEKKLREDIEAMGGLEKNDMPAMIISALLVFMPIAIAIMALFVLVALFFL